MLKIIGITVLSTIATIIAAGLLAGGVCAYHDWRHGGDEL